jgi:hypothetical protein
MDGGIGKGPNPNHPTHVQKLVIAQDSAQWPHRERDEQEYQRPAAGAVDLLSDRPRIEPNRVGLVNHLAERREQAHQRNDTERRYAVAGITPNLERVSQRIFPDEHSNDVNDNNIGDLEKFFDRVNHAWESACAPMIPMPYGNRCWSDGVYSQRSSNRLEPSESCLGDKDYDKVVGIVCPCQPEPQAREQGE